MKLTRKQCYMGVQRQKQMYYGWFYHQKVNVSNLLRHSNHKLFTRLPDKSTSFLGSLVSVSANWYQKWLWLWVITQSLLIRTLIMGSPAHLKTTLSYGKVLYMRSCPKPLQPQPASGMLHAGIGCRRVALTTRKLRCTRSVSYLCTSIRCRSLSTLTGSAVIIVIFIMGPASWSYFWGPHHMKSNQLVRGDHE